MEDSLFVELVRALTAQEKAQVLQFSELTSMNSGKMKRFVRPLLEYCFQFDWGAKESLPSREQVYRAVFGNEEMVEGKMPKLMVEASKLIKASLISSDYMQEKNEFDQSIRYAEILRKRGLEQRCIQILEKLKKKQSELIVLDSDHFYRQYVLEKSLHDLATLHNNLKGDLNIPNVLDKAAKTGQRTGRVEMVVQKSESLGQIIPRSPMLKQRPHSQKHAHQ